jgi:Ser/Thr protein kinase RdoA (MazF antagonist)
MLVPYPSYINRVYGIRSETGDEYLVKFYRPDRWEEDAIRDEHRFLLDCAEAELPVVAPIADEEGETLEILSVEAIDAGTDFIFPFALFAKMGGRNFDPEGDEDWRRIGALAGRLHQVAGRRSVSSRAVCNPDLTAGFVTELLAADVVHPEARPEFESICSETLARIRPLFKGLVLGRVHGDLHRGNILDRPGTGLVLFDFDDMMIGPAVQDLWLLLPERADESRRELGLLLEAYEEFSPFDHSTLRLIEPLRFMRMVYFLAWRSRQRNDFWFHSSFPDWGTKAFWLKENEDLRDQARALFGTAD